MEEVLRLTNVNKSFGEHHVLHDVSFAAGRGELIGYIGPNGSGKSTTVKLMLGILGGYTGTIEVFGKNIEEDLKEDTLKLPFWIQEVLAKIQEIKHE